VRSFAVFDAPEAVPVDNNTDIHDISFMSTPIPDHEAFFRSLASYVLPFTHDCAYSGTYLRFVVQERKRPGLRTNSMRVALT
jgi:hypothetical protein